MVVALLLRARDFGNPVIHVDEQYYLLVGDRLVHGARLYLDVWDRKPFGLFLLFAAIRLLPGNGILAYQLVATLFAAATAIVIGRAARTAGARGPGAMLAGIAYLVWLSLLSGRGGQSPVFYNLFVAGAGLLTLRLPALAERRSTGAILRNGAAACALAGLAIQTKYTPLVEGAFFGLAHCRYWRLAGGSWASLAPAAALWALLGIAPTAAVVAAYAGTGQQHFDLFWFSNFASVGMRRGYPAAKIAARLLGTSAQLSPLAFCCALAWRRARPAAPRLLLAGWLAAALVGFAMIGAFFDHYALPLLVPLTIIAALAFDASRRTAMTVLAIGAGLFAFHTIEKPNRYGPAVRAMAAAMEARDGTECPYVFAGDVILYHLAHACLPTAYAFPSTLAYESERGATGIDETAEVARIMARRPPAVVTMATPLAPWNRGSLAIVSAALARDYHLAMTVRREGGDMLLYLRDRAPPDRSRHPSGDT